MKLYNATNENAMHVTTKAPKVCDVKPNTNCPQRSRGSTCKFWEGLIDKREKWYKN